MIELAAVRSFGPGIPVEELLATRTDGNPVPLPPIEELVLYRVATAERERAGPIRIRLWTNERDATAFLTDRFAAGHLVAAGVYTVLPKKAK